ncbi:signal peptidase II [Pacificitalea manganoxidans]|uniref:Lipoprotein signal peptidase n=1 Tax=Pacificitalea manganoxidans TaxID=1411902 RepID=A0A291LVQ6_9RHOB|nr:signal peptidase II [Pacificitalea manganoxidans]ATI40568.1 signal peptidase II [Pacificitalea manganoxidans]MDR6309551.1 signal peptidase II [Pacificitalea manganoxidans]OWU69785.1 hypothetical protein ATO2_08465 [Roseovarius sp. 22II1-1F6A]|tara:strand:+ start:86 stop:556 length:471 start_codon:yes stop_codon:yes gene_type:complete
MRLLWITAALAFVLDQITKYGVIYGLALQPGQSYELLPPLVTFRKGLNTGINFGLLHGHPDITRWALFALALAICVALVIWAKRSFTRTAEFASAGLVLGGALGNAVDRVFHRGVLDFLNMSCCGINNPYIFNVADIFIFAGAIGLLVWGGSKKAA